MSRHIEGVSGYIRETSPQEPIATPRHRPTTGRAGPASPGPAAASFRAAPRARWCRRRRGTLRAMGHCCCSGDSCAALGTFRDRGDGSTAASSARLLEQAAADLLLTGAARPGYRRELRPVRGDHPCTGGRQAEVISLMTAPGEGFEPSFYGPKPHVLPIGRPGTAYGRHYSTGDGQSPRFAGRRPARQTGSRRGPRGQAARTPGLGSLTIRGGRAGQRSP